MSQPLSQHELECIGAISRLAEDMGIPILVVGASARELAFNSPFNIAPHRSTKDWDFGIRVESWDVYTRFRDALLKMGSFHLDPVRENRLVYTTGMMVDLIPFGGLEVNGHIEWPQSKSEMNVIGFSDAYDHCMEVQLSDNLRIRVALPPVLAALKFLTFADRKDRTDRDIHDLWNFISNYRYAIQETRLWNEPFVSARGDDFDWSCAGAFLLGYDVASACCLETVERLTPIIAMFVDPYSRYITPLIGSYSSSDEQKKREDIAKNFDWLKKGIELAVQGGKT
jgi:predicted nucleotidyltransferase